SLPPVSVPLAAPCLLRRSHTRRALPSFPTRRSSDLRVLHLGKRGLEVLLRTDDRVVGIGAGLGEPPDVAVDDHTLELDVFVEPRSEEHTSELQSRENLVCRLLLEKKKTTRHYHYTDT